VYNFNKLAKDEGIMVQEVVTLSRSEQKRQAVLDAAVQEFQRCGFAGASMDAIAELAQVSKRTVYNHFGSKEILFEQATVLLWSRSKAAATVAFDATRPLAEQLAQIARQSWAFYQQNDFIELARVVMAEYIRQPERAVAAMAQLEQQEGGLESWLKAAVAAGALDVPDLKLAASQFWGLFKTFSFWPKVFQLGSYDAQQQQIIESNVAMFLALYQAKR
jgi:TetR/AcrR family transcriptional regulator, regulator of autoinduction and epiphytic fitness